jgi:hypothetical protein
LSKPAKVNAAANDLSKQSRLPVMVSPVCNEERNSQTMLIARSADAASLQLPPLGKSRRAKSVQKPVVTVTPIPIKSGDACLRGSNLHRDKGLTPTVPVDTSTAHVQALIGENGASVCLGIRSCTLEQGEENGRFLSEDGAKKHHSTFTEEERAQQSRDRNRRHARNTRD